MELPPEAERYRLGEFILDLSRFQLTHRGELVPLQAKALDLLAALVRAGGEVVDHDALHRSLWPDVVVTDQSLRQAAMKLRKGLGERADLVETVPRRGLRWAGPIEREADGEPRAASPEPIAALVERDTFLGRTGELSSIEQAFASGSRVVSLVGPPGVGKTRLALRFARSYAEKEAGAVFSCDLSEVGDEESLRVALARSLALDPALCRDPDGVGSTLARVGPCLLLLDSAERVAEAAARWVVRWSGGETEARLLVSSRSALQIVGETVIVIPPLDVRTAVELFRARASAAGFSSASSSDATLESLVELLDGLPLCVELAAARSAAMTPERMLSHMRERLRWLASRVIGRPERHYNLRAAIGWSFELLPPDERSALVQMSVFDGSFSIEALEAVLSLGELWPMDAAQALVSRSLVQRLGDGRLSLLRSVKDYAREQISPEELEGAALRHGAFFAELGERVVLSRPPEDDRALRESLADHADLLAAARRAIARSDGDIAVKTALAANYIEQWIGGREASSLLDEISLAGWLSGVHARYRLRLLLRQAMRRGPAADGSELVERCEAAWSLATLPEDKLYAAKVTGTVYGDLGRWEESRAWFDRALEIARASGDIPGEREVLSSLGAELRAYGDLDGARLVISEASALARQHGLPEAIDRFNLGLVLRDLGCIGESEQVIAEALDLYRAAGDRRGEAIATAALGSTMALQERFEEADVLLQRALDYFSRFGPRDREGTVLANQARAREARGDVSGAIRLYDRAIASLQGHTLLQVAALGALGALQCRVGQHEAGERALAQAERIARAFGFPRALAKILSERAEAAASRGASDEASRFSREIEALSAAEATIRGGEPR